MKQPLPVFHSRADRAAQRSCGTAATYAEARKVLAVRAGEAETPNPVLCADSWVGVSDAAPAMFSDGLA